MEEEYTFIVDLSSRTQRARCRCSSTTTRLACQSGSGSWTFKTWTQKESPGYTHCTNKEGEGCWHGPCLHFVAEKSQVHFARASNATFRGHKDRSQVDWPRFLLSGPNAQTLSDYLCLWFQHRSLHCLSEERAEFSYVYSVPVSQLKCKPCVGSRFCFSSQQQRGRVGVTANGL